MRASALDLHGVLRLERDVWRDERGLFLETWNPQALARVGLEAEFVQDNLSLSQQWTVRGLHYQLQQPQGKLISVITGSIYDVVVDLRCSSRTFRRAIGIHLSAEDYEALWVPPGCAHGFLALEHDTRVAYKVTDYWAPQFERTLLWCDPALAISWPIPGGIHPIVSNKDAAGTPLEQTVCYE